VQGGHHHRKRRRNRGASGEARRVAEALDQRPEEQWAGCQPEEQDGAVHAHRDSARRSGGQVAENDAHRDERDRCKRRADGEHDRRGDKAGRVTEHDQRSGKAKHSDEYDRPAMAGAVDQPAAREP
jgi:hypothetical protein